MELTDVQLWHRVEVLQLLREPRGVLAQPHPEAEYVAEAVANFEHGRVRLVTPQPLLLRWLVERDRLAEDCAVVAVLEEPCVGPRHELAELLSPDFGGRRGKNKIKITHEKTIEWSATRNRRVETITGVFYILLRMTSGAKSKADSCLD